MFMEEVLECGECGEVFSTEDTLLKHAELVHGNEDVEIREGRANKSVFSSLVDKLKGK